MSNKGFELSNRQLNLILIFCVITLVIYLITIEITRDDKISTRDSLNYIREEQYQGVVKFKDYDRSNHNNPTLYFTNDFQVSISSKFWLQIKIGDSLVKKSGETTIRIYRNNRIIILDNQDILKSFQNQ